MNRGAKIVIVAVVALFALTGIYYAFSSPKSRTTASRDADAGSAESAAGRISDPIAPGASVPQTLTMGPSSTASATGAAATPPDAAFAKPATGSGMPSGAASSAPGGAAATAPGAPSATIGTNGTAAAGATPNSLAPMIAPQSTPGTTPSTAGSPRILPPERTTAASPSSPSPAASPSINPPGSAATAKPSTSAAATPGMTSYTIKAGDTFSTIAGEFYKDTRKWSAIANANPGVDPAKLKVGQVIKVPADGAIARQATTVAERASAAPRSSGSTHTVAKGETLAAIAERYLGSKGAWKRLYEANKDAIGSDPAKLKVGTKLVIPAT